MIPGKRSAFAEFFSGITQTDIRVFAFLLLSCLLLRLTYFFGSSFWSYEELFYAMGAKKILGGSVLYRDFIDLKPPGIYVVYAALIKISGYGNILYAIKIATCFFEIVTAFVFYKIAVELLDRQKAFVFVVAFMAALSVNRTGWLLYVFVITLLPWALFLFYLVRNNICLRASDRFISGIFLGFTVLCSNQFAVFVGLLPAFLLLTGTPVRQIPGKSIIFFAGFLMPILAVGAYFALQGALFDWYWCNFVWVRYYNGEYSMQQMLHNLFKTFAATYEWIPLYILAVMGVFSFYRNRHEISRQGYVFIIVLFGLLILSRLVLARPAARYNIYLLPLFALLVSFVEFSKIRRVFLIAGALASAALFVHVNADALAYPPDDAVEKTAAVSEWIVKNVPEKEKIFIWHSGIFLYHSSNRDMATGFFFPELYLDNPAMAARMQAKDIDHIWQKFRSQLSTDRPAYIADITGNLSKSNANSRPTKIHDYMAWFADFLNKEYILVKDFTDFVLKFENTEGESASESVKIWKRRESD